MTVQRQVEVRFFAALREQLQCTGLVLDLTPDVVTVGQLRALLLARNPDWAAAFSRDRPLRMAYQQIMCDDTQLLDPSAPRHEVAFFPPVTGG